MSGARLELLAQAVVPTQPKETTQTTQTSLTSTIANGLKYIWQVTRRLAFDGRVIQVSKVISNLSLVGMGAASAVDPELGALFTTANVLNGLNLTYSHRHRKRVVLDEIREEQQQEQQESYKTVEINEHGQELALRPQLRPRPQFRRHLNLQTDKTIRPEPVEGPSITHLLYLMQPSNARALVPLRRPVPAQQATLILLFDLSQAIDFFTATMAIAMRASQISAQTMGFEAFIFTSAFALEVGGHIRLLQNQSQMLRDSLWQLTSDHLRDSSPRHLPAGRPQQNPNTMFALNNAPRSRPQPSFSRPRSLPSLRSGFQPSSVRSLSLPNNEQRLTALGFPTGLVPKEYRCTMMDSVMDNPVPLPHNGDRIDQQALLEHFKTKKENPYTHQPMTDDDAKKVDGDLKNEIDSFVKNVEQGVIKKREELGHDQLSEADYESVKQTALNNNSSNPSSSSSPSL